MRERKSGGEGGEGSDGDRKEERENQRNEKRKRKRERGRKGWMSIKSDDGEGNREWKNSIFKLLTAHCIAF